MQGYGVNIVVEGGELEKMRTWSRGKSLKHCG